MNNEEIRVIPLDNTTRSKIVRRLIVLSWVFVLCAFLSRIIFNKPIPIKSTNQTFIKVCSFIDSHIVVEYLVSLVFTSICCSLYCLAIIERKKFSLNETIIMLVVLPISVCVKVVFRLEPVSDIIETLFLPLILCHKYYWKHWNVLFRFCLLILFQFVSIYIRGVPFYVVQTSSIISIILLIDILFMLFLYYIYTNTSGFISTFELIYIAFDKSTSHINKAIGSRKSRLAKLSCSLDKKEIEKINNELGVLYEKLYKKSK